MKYITILPIVIYLILFWHKYGIKKSISATYKSLNDKQRPILWAALMLTCLFIVSFYVISHDNLWANIFIAFAGIGIAYSTTAQRFDASVIEGKFHSYGAILGYIFGYLFLLAAFNFDSVYFIVPSLLLMWIVAKKDKNNYIWWFEIIGMITIYLGTIL